MKWTPVFITASSGPNGPQPKHTALPDRSTDECPRSIIDRDPEAYEIVMLYLQAKRIGLQLGEILFGDSPHDWPVWVADAAILLSGEETHIENAMNRQTAMTAGMK